MKKINYCFLVLSISLSFTASANILNDYSNIYADQLISDFDRRLDDPSFNPMESDLYFEILAARALIEKTGGTNFYGSSSLLSVKNSMMYGLVSDTIKKSAIVIKQQVSAQIKSNNLQIYPSLGGTGNLTGNTYPSNSWSLTFDDGPRGDRTKTIVDNLYSRGIKANFFMLTQEANRYKTTVDYVRDAGMEISLHSYTHANLDKANQQTLRKEIISAKKELEEISKTSIKLFRLPYGAGTRNTSVRKMIADENMVHVFWNVDTLDWKDKNPQSVYARTIKQMAKTPRNSGIILFHDIHQTTIQASELVMDYLLRNNKDICTVGEMVDYHNGGTPDCLN